MIRGRWGRTRPRRGYCVGEIHIGCWWSLGTNHLTGSIILYWPSLLPLFRLLTMLSCKAHIAVGLQTIGLRGLVRSWLILPLLVVEALLLLLGLRLRHRPVQVLRQKASIPSFHPLPLPNRRIKDLRDHVLEMRYVHLRCLRFEVK